MRRIAIWRHGRTSWNAEQRFQGQTDIELDEVGIAQAQRAASMLASLPPSAIISSDLTRTRQTASPLVAITGIEPAYDEGLRETFAGEWEGKTRPVLLEEYGDDLHRWSADPLMRAGGHGETRVEVADRVVAAIDRGLAGLPEDGVLIVVTHGGAARAGIGRLLGLPPEHWGALGVLTNCSWSVLLENTSHGPDWRLQEYNAGSLPEAIPPSGVWPADDR
ncbi:MAG: histidine phosphatase family protein [Candidatus Nanopelagicales bacterium]|jgi:broad specificity phosphatase PhoE